MVLKSFVEVEPESHFPLENLPYGVFKPEPGSVPRPGVAIGDYVLDLSALSSAGLFDGPLLKNSDCFNQVGFIFIFIDFWRLLVGVLFVLCLIARLEISYR